ncbi:RNA polymerase sigma factor [Tenacibaculum sp. C7A-26P2]|uniref:RNA polymerase sigma factor n=1 Tax=Tenacibaculum sp. C7A-26P2 TaxID=3447504 RepID=UPI003F84DE74
MKQSDFLKAVLPFKDRIFRLAKRLLVSTAEAEDATQELYLKLWKNKEKLKRYKSVEAFAITMTKNYCFDRLKSKQASNLSLVHTNYKEKGITLDKKIENNDAVAQVRLLIEKLPEQQKAIIQLRDIEQYELDEICKIMEMKSTAVRVALSRARKKIRQELIKRYNYGVS